MVKAMSVSGAYFGCMWLTAFVPEHDYICVLLYHINTSSKIATWHKFSIT